MVCFKLNWIIYTIWVKYCNYENLFGRYAIRYESCLTIFFLQTQQIEVWLVAITLEFDLSLAYTPFHFSQTLPLIGRLLEITSTVPLTSLRIPQGEGGGKEKKP